VLTEEHSAPRQSAESVARSETFARGTGARPVRPFDDVFYHDVRPQLAAAAQRRERDELSKALREPWPLDAWPETPTKYLLCRDDRMFTAAWARRHARERLGIEADEMDGGHYVTLSRPRELAERLHSHAASLA
jgi:hypothetical protein